MPTEILGITQLAPLVEKLGIVGLLLIAVAWLVWERLRLVKQSVRTFRQRDRWRQIAERYRGAIVAAGAAIPDIADIDRDFAGDKED